MCVFLVVCDGCVCVCGILAGMSCACMSVSVAAMVEILAVFP